MEAILCLWLANIWHGLLLLSVVFQNQGMKWVIIFLIHQSLAWRRAAHNFLCFFSIYCSHLSRCVLCGFANSLMAGGGISWWQSKVNCKWIFLFILIVSGWLQTCKALNGQQSELESCHTKKISFTIYIWTLNMLWAENLRFLLSFYWLN